MIGGFRSVLCVFVFQGSLLVIVIMKATFELQSSHVCEKRSKIQNDPNKQITTRLLLTALYLEATFLKRS